MRLIQSILALLIFQTGFGQNQSLLDSINKYIDLSKNTNYSPTEKLEYALKSKEYSDNINNDSIKLAVQRNLSVAYFNNADYENYVQLNISNYKLGSKLNDSSAVAVAALNLGSYYRFTEENDSSYFYHSKALKFLSPKEVSERKADALFYLADIQQIEKLYVGAEEDAIKAIKILNLLPKTEESLDLYWNLYNLIAKASREQTNFDKALEYYDKSIDISEEMKDGYGYKIYSLNNKANFYREIEQYKSALNIYQDLVDERGRYEEEDRTFYPAVIINIGKTRFESGDYDFDLVENNFLEGYRISKEIEDEFTLMAAASELSKLYVAHNMLEKAKTFGNEALKIANEVSSNEYKMEALLTLSKVYDGDKGKGFLLEHISLNDSIMKAERFVQNKYARIELETDQLEAENEQITKERLYLLILSIALMLTAILIYVIITQRAKNKELQLIQEQQKANEDIYNLMLNQQDKVEEARAQEKIRVSKELHDGVLGRLFGTRLSLDSLNFTEGKEAIKSRAAYIGQLKTIEEDIRKISHELNTDFVSGSGFMDIVSELIETQSNAYDLKHAFHFTDDINWDLVSNKVKINLYRIIQESMQNIYKHADATQIDISVLLKNDVIWLKIVDDGRGFDADRGRKGIGLKNMQSRITEIDGSIEFLSKPNKGTTVHVKLPYNADV